MIKENDDPIVYAYGITWSSDHIPGNNETAVDGNGSSLQISVNDQVFVTTGDPSIWVCTDSTPNSMTWLKIADTLPANLYLPDTVYTSINLPFNQGRTLKNGKMVHVCVKLGSTLLEDSSVSLNADTGTGSQVIANSRLSGVEATMESTLSAFVPSGATYNITSDSGNNSIVSIFEI